MSGMNIFREMEILQREMNAIFGGQLQRQAVSERLPTEKSYQSSPRVNLSEDADNFYLATPLPGVESASLEISVVGKNLTLSGDRHKSNPEGARWQRQERTQGRFTRTLELPLEVEVDKISAEYLDGVLHILIPKAEAAKPRRISIKANS